MKPSAEQAIKILKPLQHELGSEYLAYWALPNVILTLSGARPFCDGVFWDEDKKGLLENWAREIAQSIKIIEQQTKVLWSESGIEEVRPGEKCARYDLILDDGLSYELASTKLLKGAVYEALKHQNKAEGFIKVLVDNLKSQASFKATSDENLQHIATGIMLGYPDKAVVELVISEEAGDTLSDQFMHADIRGADYYICPQPVYDYPRSLVDDPSIKDHEKLWSSILEDYYSSNFHKSLEKDQAFMRKMAELNNLK